MLYLFKNKQIALRNTLLNKDSPLPPSCSRGFHMPTVLSYNFQDTWSTLIEDPETTFGYLQLTTPLVMGAPHSSIRGGLLFLPYFMEYPNLST